MAGLRWHIGLLQPLNAAVFVYDGIFIGANDMRVANPGFDVTPPELVTGIITEAGVVAATREGLSSIRTASS